MQTNCHRMLLAVFGLFVLLAPPCAYPQQKISIKGHVYDQSNCKGLGHLTVRLTPSNKLQYQAELITSTDENGDFQIEVQQFGDYYLSIFDGVTRVYGHVMSFPNGNKAMIALKPAALMQQKPGAGCLTPAALALSQDGDLFVLDSHSGILRYSISNRNSAPQVIAQFDASWQPIDMAIVKINQTDHLFVSTVQGSIGQLMQYSTEARFEGSWFDFSPLSGLCADESAGRVYVAAFGTDRLLEQTFFASEQSRLQIVGHLSDARDLGPLAIDEAGRTLYAAGSFTGLLYALDLKSMAVRRVAEGLGQPTAMDFDPRSKVLFIADADGRQVWAVSTSPSVGKPTVFLRSKMFSAPSAIAVGSDGKVWVGDQSAHAVFEFSRNRLLIETFK